MTRLRSNHYSVNGLTVHLKSSGTVESIRGLHGTVREVTAKRYEFMKKGSVLWEGDYKRLSDVVEALVMNLPYPQDK